MKDATMYNQESTKQKEKKTDHANIMVHHERLEDMMFVCTRCLEKRQSSSSSSVTQLLTEVEVHLDPMCCRCSRLSSIHTRREKKM